MRFDIELSPCPGLHFMAPGLHNRFTVLPYAFYAVCCTVGQPVAFGPKRV